MAVHMYKSSNQHYDSALHIVKYLVSTPTYGLYYTSDLSEPLHAFVHFPLKVMNHLQTNKCIMMPTGVPWMHQFQNPINNQMNNLLTY